MHDRIAVDFTCRRLEHLAAQTLGKPKYIDRTMNGRFGGLDRIVLIVHRRCRTGQVVNLVHFHIERESHVVTHELKARMIVELINVSLATGEQIVSTQHIVPLLQ